MRWMLAICILALNACSLPGRQTLAADPQPPDVQAIAATQAFAGRIPLVSVQPGTVAFAGPLRDAVGQALSIKPDAAFEVRAVTAAKLGPDAAAAALAGLAPLAQQVADAVAADGVQPGHVMLTAGVDAGAGTGTGTGGTGTEVLVFVK